MLVLHIVFSSNVAATAADFDPFQKQIEGLVPSARDSGERTKFFP